MEYDLIVVGGGPAGMLGAATAGAKGRKAALLERNDRLGKKLQITGNGRCNVTNCGDLDDFQKKITVNAKFLYSALRTFDSRRLIDLLNTLGVTTRVERNNRVFPASDKSIDVIKALEKHLRDNKVDILLNTAVKKVQVKEQRVSGVLTEDNKFISGKNVLIATGGLSYRQTGSTGDGYKLAESLGHSLVKPRAALVPLEIKEPWVKQLQGLALENIRVKGLVAGRVKAEQWGDLLFTHYGVSGPAVLNLSSYLNVSPAAPFLLEVDLKPNVTIEQLDRFLQVEFSKNAGRYLKNSLGNIIPHRMLPVLLDLAGLDSSKKVDQISKEERGSLARTMKSVPMTVKGTRPLNEAIITSGGIETREINPSTMESKIVKGLYFAGEVIDVDALTGGYNLQIAFSTGYVSGLHAAKNNP